MSLDSMEPNPAWDAASHADAVDALSTPGLTVKVWGGDWCPDCRRLLPDLGAALDAAGVPEENVEAYPVDGDKEGELTDEYDVAYIPTVVVERDGEELVRFVEDEGMAIPEYLAERLRERGVTA
jgi:thiol-disulfide isomerase/thioredoxin